MQALAVCEQLQFLTGKMGTSAKISEALVPE